MRVDVLFGVSVSEDKDQHPAHSNVQGSPSTTPCMGCMVLPKTLLLLTVSAEISLRYGLFALHSLTVSRFPVRRADSLSPLSRTLLSITRDAPSTFSPLTLLSVHSLLSLVQHQRWP